MDPDDIVSTRLHLESTWKKDVVFVSEAGQPFAFGISTEWMRKMAADANRNVFFLDASFRHLTKYRNSPLYILLAVNEDTRLPVPIYFFYLEHDNEIEVEKALQHFKDLTKVDPVSVMVDKSLIEINALGKVFPKSKSLLCYFHVKQAVGRWLSKYGHNKSLADVESIMLRLKKANSVS